MVSEGGFIKDWITEQRNSETHDWEQTIQKFYPQCLKAWTEAREHFRALQEDWNFLDAVKYLDWGTLVDGSNMRALDLGSGTGWLAAFLSRFPNIKKIDALDSSRFNLTVMLPEIVRMMDGDMCKIEPVLGLFNPLPVENGYYDIVVASSAIHHSASLFQVLKECNRVLKMNGKLVILNETPLTTLRYCLKVVKFFCSVIGCLIKRDFPELSPALSRSGILYDPYLRDNIYTYSQWEQAIKQTGFSFKLIATPYFTEKKKKRQVVKLSHFICVKV